MRNFTTLILTLLLTLCGATTAQAQTFVTYAETSTPASEIETGLYVIKGKVSSSQERWLYVNNSDVYFSENIEESSLKNVWQIEKRDDGSFYMMNVGTSKYLKLGGGKDSEDTNPANNCHVTTNSNKNNASYFTARTFADHSDWRMDDNSFVIFAGAPTSTGNRHRMVIYNGQITGQLSTWTESTSSTSIGSTTVQFDFYKVDLDYTALQQNVPTLSEGCLYYLQGANGNYISTTQNAEGHGMSTSDKSSARTFYVKKIDDLSYQIFTDNGTTKVTYSNALWFVPKSQDEANKDLWTIKPVSGTEYFTLNDLNSGTLQYMLNSDNGSIVGKGTDPTAENARWKFVPANDAATEAASLTANVQTGDAVHGNVTTFSASYPVAIPNGYKAYTATYEASSNVINVTELAGKVIPANTGVLLRGEVNASLSIKPTMQTGTAVTGNVLTAVGDADKTFDTTTDTKIYLLGKQDGNLCFRHMSTSGTQTIGKHKAYINLSGVSNENLATLRIRFDGEATGIANATMTQQGVDNSMFDLSGRRVSRPTHGIYIKGGKKVIF